MANAVYMHRSFASSRSYLVDLPIPVEISELIVAYTPVVGQRQHLREHVYKTRLRKQKHCVKHAYQRSRYMR